MRFAVHEAVCSVVEFSVSSRMIKPLTHVESYREENENLIYFSDVNSLLAAPICCSRKPLSHVVLLLILLVYLVPPKIHDDSQTHSSPTTELPDSHFQPGNMRLSQLFISTDKLKNFNGRQKILVRK